jgi:Tol biopolymer transport system component
VDQYGIAAAVVWLTGALCLVSGTALAAKPDGRQWQMVSPANKHGALIEPITFQGSPVQAAANGDAIVYAANAPTEETPQGNRSPELSAILSHRTPSGWSSQDIAPPQGAIAEIFIGKGQEYRLFSNDLALGILEPRGETPLPPLPPGSEKTIYIRETSGAYRALVTAGNVTPETVFGGELVFLAATPDLSHVVLFSRPPLTPGAAPNGIYEWIGGQLQLASVFPGGTPATGTVDPGGNEGKDLRHAVSDDGSRIIWTREEPPGSSLYVRDTTAGTTVRIDAAQGPSEPEQAEARFQVASADGSKVFFTDAQRLTPDATAFSSSEEHKPDVYEFDVASGKLTDITVDGNVGEAADVQGSILDASDDGSSVYFVANGMLASGATPGTCTPTPSPGTSCNLYEWHSGTIKFIASVSGEDRNDWNPETLVGMTSRVSPNGRYLAFMSNASLTGYDNADAASGQPDEEVYLYDAQRERLVCASCNPTGARPTGMFESGVGLGPLVDRPSFWREHWLAANIPAWTGMSLEIALYQSRYLSDNGRLFFNSVDALAPQDTNGAADVYEFEPEGVGDCTSASRGFSQGTGGCIGLISSGSSDEESAFLDASEGGEGRAAGADAFFVTAAKLAPQDIDTAFDVYDARECTSASPCASPPPPPPPGCTTIDSCRAASSALPSNLGQPASATFSGIGAAVQGKAAPKPLTRAQKLANALKACRKKPRAKRKACEAQARKRYGVKRKTKRTRRGAQVKRGAKARAGK